MAFKSNRGFTIIEFLIVITIIMTLAVMGAGAYSAGRKIAVIDLHAEKLVSVLNSLRDKARAGAKSGATPKCYGLTFTVGSAPKLVERNYLNSRELCENTLQPVEAFEWQPDVKLKSILVSGNENSAPLDVIFYPPHGNILPITGISSDQNTRFTFIIEYKDRTRTIEVDETSGRIEKSTS